MYFHPIGQRLSPRMASRPSVAATACVVAKAMEVLRERIDYRESTVGANTGPLAYTSIFGNSAGALSMATLTSAEGGGAGGAGGQRVLCEGRIEVLDYRSQPNMQKFAMPLEAANGRA